MLLTLSSDNSGCLQIIDATMIFATIQIVKAIRLQAPTPTPKKPLITSNNPTLPSVRILYKLGNYSVQNGQIFNPIVP